MCHGICTPHPDFLYSCITSQSLDMFQSFHEAEEVAPVAAARGTRLGAGDTEFADAAGGAGASAAGGARRLRRFRS